MASTSPFTLDSLIGIPVTVDGTTYRLLTKDAVPLTKLKKLDDMWARYSEVAFKSDPTEDEQKEANSLPDVMCRLVFRAPDDVQQKLDDDQRIALVMAFLDPPTRRPMEAGADPASQMTGASSQPGSPGSTGGGR